MIQSKPHFTFNELTDPNFQPAITRYIDNLFIQINKSITNPFSNENIALTEIIIDFSNGLSIKNLHNMYLTLKTLWIENNDKLSNTSIIYNLTLKNKDEILYRDKFSFVNLISPKTHYKALSIVCFIKIFTYFVKTYNISSNTLDMISGLVRLSKDQNEILSIVKQKDIENVFSELQSFI